MKALSLISGGLDSILSALMVKKEGIKVTGLTFKSLFFDAKNAKKIAKNAKIPLKNIDISKEHLKIVKNPKYGYGKNANPCIDCHLLMLKQAKKIMEEEKYDFIITGDVLGQRPFSQNKNSLELLEKKSGLKGLILRPLSARLLSPTIPEQKNWVKREKLLAISGRSRKPQFQLAKKFKLKHFLAPGASCILTDVEYAKRFFKLFETNQKCNTNDINLLRLGRHFWQDRNLIIVGRNHQENLQLKKLAQKRDIILEPQTFPGPTILIRPCSKKVYPEPDAPAITGRRPFCRQEWFRAKKLLLKYSTHSPKKLLKKDFSIRLI